MSRKHRFEMNYGKVDIKSRCSLINGTIIQRPRSDLLIASSDVEGLSIAFKKLAPRYADFNPSLVTKMVLFQSEDVTYGENARSPIPSRMWEKMDTAPKDGREIIILVAKRAGFNKRCLVGHWMAGGHCIEGHPPISAGWYFWNGREFDIASEPLLWMPLPELPNEALL